MKGTARLGLSVWCVSPFLSGWPLRRSDSSSDSVTSLIWKVQFTPKWNSPALRSLTVASKLAKYFLLSLLQNHIKSLLAVVGTTALIKLEFAKFVSTKPKSKQGEMTAARPPRRRAADNEVSIGWLYPQSSCLGTNRSVYIKQTPLINAVFHDFIKMCRQKRTIQRVEGGGGCCDISQSFSW